MGGEQIEVPVRLRGCARERRRERDESLDPVRRCSMTSPGFEDDLDLRTSRRDERAEADGVAVV